MPTYEANGIIAELITKDQWRDFTITREPKPFVLRNFFNDVRVDIGYDGAINILDDVYDNDIIELAHAHSMGAEIELDHGKKFHTSLVKPIYFAKRHVTSIHELQQRAQSKGTGNTLGEKVADMCLNHHGRDLSNMVDARINKLIADIFAGGAQVSGVENGIPYELDYGQKATNVQELDWTKKDINIIRDLLDACEYMEDENDVEITGMIMHPSTLRFIANNVDVRKRLLGLNYEIELSTKKLADLLYEQFGWDIETDKTQYKEWVTVADPKTGKETIEEVRDYFIKPGQIILVNKDMKLGEIDWDVTNMDTELVNFPDLEQEQSGAIAVSHAYDAIRKQEHIIAEAYVAPVIPNANRWMTLNVKMS